VLLKISHGNFMATQPQVTPDGRYLGAAVDPKLSPDGQWIAFAHGIIARQAIAVMSLKRCATADARRPQR